MHHAVDPIADERQPRHEDCQCCKPRQPRSYTKMQSLRDYRGTNSGNGHQTTCAQGDSSEREIGEKPSIIPGPADFMVAEAQLSERERHEPSKQQPQRDSVPAQVDSVDLPACRHSIAVIFSLTGQVIKALETRCAMVRTEKLILGLIMLASAAPAVAGTVPGAPAPIAGVGIGAVALIGLGYRALKRRMDP